ncbi:hypothetical protein [Corynebacterium propinquum]|uniref:hypothetical protein n=1 Tax=Corynebacterium propinquum TaxID=43769 RepID=UPI00267051BF|nr:hypothetical protein [Corynebacterium propinquum]WKS44649.1 hypothetical protein NLL36_09270 [Corynebacterium propinquum]
MGADVEAAGIVDDLPSPTRSTTDQEKSLDFEPQSKSSMNNYNQFKTTVLQPPIESK